MKMKKNCLSLSNNRLQNKLSGIKHIKKTAKVFSDNINVKYKVSVKQTHNSFKIDYVKEHKTHLNVNILTQLLKRKTQIYSAINYYLLILCPYN
jgi:hypothetical protein